MEQTITITWKAFGSKAEIGRYVTGTTITTAFPSTVSHQEILEIVYADTNLYQGYIWNLLQPVLPVNRTHTALSVGDEVEIDGQLYVCADMGFTAIEKASA